MQNAKDTEVAIRAAMKEFETIVMHERYFDPITQSQQYPHAISRGEVLRLAKVRSRATLLAEYHQKLREDLETFIEDLKKRGGKKKVASSNAPKTGNDANCVMTPAARFEQLTQTVGALQYRILELEKQLEECRANKSRVVDFKTRRQRNTAA